MSSIKTEQKRKIETEQNSFIGRLPFCRLCCPRGCMRRRLPHSGVGVVCFTFAGRQPLIRRWLSHWVYHCYFFPTINNHQTQIRQSLVKVFPFFIPYLFFSFSSSLGTLCHGLILYCTCAPDQTNPKGSNSIQSVRVSPHRRSLIRLHSYYVAHVIACTWPCTWLNSGLNRTTLFSFHLASLSFVHMGFIIFMGITLLLHERVPR